MPGGVFPLCLLDGSGSFFAHSDDSFICERTEKSSPLTLTHTRTPRTQAGRKVCVSASLETSFATLHPSQSSLCLSVFRCYLHKFRVLPLPLSPNGCHSNGKHETHKKTLRGCFPRGKLSISGILGWGWGKQLHLPAKHHQVRVKRRRTPREPERKNASPLYAEKSTTERPLLGRSFPPHLCVTPGREGRERQTNNNNSNKKTINPVRQPCQLLYCCSLLAWQR